MEEHILDFWASSSRLVTVECITGNLGKLFDNNGLDFNLVTSELRSKIGLSDEQLTSDRSWICCLFQRRRALLAGIDTFVSKCCFRALRLLKVIKE